ncbi:MAG: putative transposase, partial [Dehalococcoidales bacterium]|nr:putative transposase [Dehalococcoidales bacterium]
LKVRRGMVSKWRVRFARQHMDGLMDKPRRGAKVKYGEDMERRILTQLDVPPPPGYTTWTGGLDTGLPFVSCDKVDTALAEAASKKCVSYRHPGARGYQTITADTGNDSRYSWRIREHQQNVQKGK